MSELQVALQDLTPAEDRVLAIKFEVAVATVERWRLGTARPHPALAALIADAANLIKNRKRR